MINKKSFIICGILHIILIILIIVYALFPKLELFINGTDEITLLVGDEYKEQGAEARLTTIFGTKEVKVEISSNVDSSKLGKYIVTYNASKKNFKK